MLFKKNQEFFTAFASNNFQYETLLLFDRYLSLKEQAINSLAMGCTSPDYQGHDGKAIVKQRRE
jgi:hypothetical protein